MNVRSISLGVLAVISTTALAYQAVGLAWSPKVGAVLKYNSVVTFPGHSGDEMQVFETITQKVLSVSKDKVTVQEHASMVKVLSGGNDVTSMMGSQNGSPRTLTFSSAGTLVAQDGGHPRVMSSPRMERVMSFVFPKNPVKPGDKWSLKLAANAEFGAVEGTMTFVGSEEVHGKKVNKIRAEVGEIGVAEKVSVTRTLWLSADDGSLLKSETKAKNMPMPHDMDPVDATVVWTLTK